MDVMEDSQINQERERGGKEDNLKGKKEIPSGRQEMGNSQIQFQQFYFLYK